MRAVREDLLVDHSASFSLQEGWAHSTTKALGRAGQSFSLGNSSVSGGPQVSNGCQEIRSKPQFPQGRSARDRTILRLNFKLERRLGAATTGILLRRPQCLALGSSCLGCRAGSVVKTHTTVAEDPNSMVSSDRMGQPPTD